MWPKISVEHLVYDFHIIIVQDYGKTHEDAWRDNWDRVIGIHYLKPDTGGMVAADTGGMVAADTDGMVGTETDDGMV